jgi:hypothetical protein
VLAQAPQLGEDLALELALLEADDEDLHRSEFHLDSLLRARGRLHALEQLLALGLELLLGEDARVEQRLELVSASIRSASDDTGAVAGAASDGAVCVSGLAAMCFPAT